MDLANNLNVLFDKLHNVLRTETVIGQPVEVGNVTIIPVVSVSVGAGSGVGQGHGEKGEKGDGGGGVGGGKVSPVAMIIIKGDEVNVTPVSGRGSLEKIAEIVPEIVAQLKSKEPAKSDDEKKEETEQE